MERLGGEYAPIVEKMGCSNNSHRKQSGGPIIMTDTILATGNIGTIGTEEVVKQLSEKYTNFLESGAFSKVTLTLQETKGSRLMAMRKFAECYAEKELR
jgi:hypothetical protein